MIGWSVNQVDSVRIRQTDTLLIYSDTPFVCLMGRFKQWLVHSSVSVCF